MHGREASTAPIVNDPNPTQGELKSRSAAASRRS
jgi:hypothetical protein